MSGIGQVTRKYAKLLGADYYVAGRDRVPPNEHVFMYALPIEHDFQLIRDLKTRSKSVTCMTICETETVHDDYGKLFRMFDGVAVQSKFCLDIFTRQFLDSCYFFIIHQYVPPIYKQVMPDVNFGIDPTKYTFYHIGNIIDQRKNIRNLIDAFYRCGFGHSAQLVLKATCNRRVEMNLPNVVILNGLIEDENVLQQLHHRCNCYVSFSHSEGIGMGAVEAALHDKPVIITEFGGACEYVKTPYTVRCGRTQLQRDDFLFKKGMVWGDPDKDQLIQFMQDAHAQKLNHMDHTHTKFITGAGHVLDQFRVNVVGCKHNKPDEDAAGHERPALGDEQH